MIEWATWPKTCTKCGETKPSSEFYTDPNESDGRDYHCSSCRRAWKRQHYLSGGYDARYTPIAKRCGHCRQVLPSTAFAPHKRQLDGLQGYCRACSSEYSKRRWRQRHDQSQPRTRQRA